MRVIVLSLLLLTACQTTTPANNSDAAESIGYMKDERTDLCFATISSLNTRDLSTSVSITCVPCTHEVDSIIQATK